MGFAENKRAKWLHVISGLTTLAVVSLTDYQAAERQSEARINSQPNYPTVAAVQSQPPQGNRQEKMSQQAVAAP